MGFKKRACIYRFKTKRKCVALDAPMKKICCPDDVAAVVRKITRGDAREHFFVFLLDVRNKLIGYEMVGVGGLTEISISPREIFRPAIAAPAAAIILAHNHPSGSHEPSEEDENLTRRMCLSGNLLATPVLDHVVVGEHGYTSLQHICDAMKGKDNE